MKNYYELPLDVENALFRYYDNKMGHPAEKSYREFLKEAYPRIKFIYKNSPLTIVEGFYYECEEDLVNFLLRWS